MHPAESPNPRSTHLDTLSAEAIVRLMCAEDRTVPDAVLAESIPIAAAIDLIAIRLAAGGRLLLAGAGTSGRLGVLDASECPPTFGVPPEQVVGIIAGGDRALRDAVEGAEDDRDQGRQDLASRHVGDRDVVVGIAASGRTPYVLAALGYARERGAATIGITTHRDTPLASLVDVLIAPLTGPEVLTGSTRLKAGTATKLVLNMLSTGAMVRTGHVYGNLMVDVRPTNAKLLDRATRIVGQVADVTAAEAREALDRAGGEVKTAIVILRRGVSPDEARTLLGRAGGRLREALAQGSPDPAVEQALFIGIDGGATKTVAWLADEAGHVIGRGLGGPGNPRSVGFPEAERNVDAAIGAAFAEAGQPRRPVARAGLALAGVGRAAERDEIRAWAERAGIAHEVIVTDDAGSVLAAGAADGWGVALIAGTGSVAVGRNDQGETARAGGWGYLLADEGGAYAIAVAGLRAAVRAADGLGPATLLGEALMARLDAKQPSDFVARIYGSDMTREQVGLLASTVFEVARADAVAAQIVNEAAEALAGLVGRIVTVLRLPTEQYPLVLAGSVITRQPDYRERLLAHLAASATLPGMTVTVTDPVAGALRLAREGVGA